MYVTLGRWVSSFLPVLQMITGRAPSHWEFPEIIEFSSTLLNSPFPDSLLVRVTLNNTEKFLFSTFIRHMMLVEGTERNSECCGILARFKGCLNGRWGGWGASDYKRARVVYREDAMRFCLSHLHARYACCVCLCRACLQSVSTAFDALFCPKCHSSVPGGDSKK